jgi:hypothetical protein
MLRSFGGNGKGESSMIRWWSISCSVCPLVLHKSIMVVNGRFLHPVFDLRSCPHSSVCLVFSVEAHLLEFNAPFVASSSLVKDCSVGALFPLPFEGLDGPSVDPLSRDARQHG